MRHPHPRVVAVVLILVAALAAASCGDSTDDQVTAARQQAAKLAAQARKAIEDAAKSAHSSTTIDGSLGTAKKRTFKTVDAKVRFVNTYADGGTATPLDIYFGDAATGKKAVTLEYGDASDYLPVQVDADPLLTPADGSVEMLFSASLPDKTAISDQIISANPTYEAGGVLTVIFTWSDGTGSGGHTSGTSTVVNDSKTKTPPDGKAYVFKNESGISGIDGGQYITVAPEGTCDWTTGTDDDAGETNGGVPYLADPGHVTLQVSDENTDCASAVTTADVDLAAGDAWIIVMYGTTKDDRKALPQIGRAHV